MRPPCLPLVLRTLRVLAAASAAVTVGVALVVPVSAGAVSTALPDRPRPVPSPVLVSASALAQAPTAATPDRHTVASERPTTVSIPDFRLAPLGPPPQPMDLRIPAIGVATDLAELGLRDDRRIEVPDDPDQAGWYRHRPVPGEAGAGVIVGHVDSHTGPAVFFELRLLDVGDRLTVARDDGSVAVFAVTSVETHPKDRFPTRRVYGPTAGHELRLVTCGGAFDEQQRSYEENVVVFAELVAVL